MSALPRAARRLSLAGLLVVGGPALATPIELLDAGQEPRQSLLLAPEVGGVEQVRMTTEMSAAMTLAGMAVPPMTLPAMVMDLDLTVLDVGTDGTVRYDSVISAVGVEGEGLDPEVEQALLGELQSMVGAHVVAAVSPDRQTLSAEVKPPAGSDPAQFAQLTQGLDQVDAPVPLEPVGVGARWVMRQDVEQQGVSASQTITYTVVAMDETGATVAADVIQSAPTQVVAMDGMPPGSQVTLQRLESTGSGTTLIQRHRVMPAQSAVTIAMAMQMEAVAEGQTVPMQMDMTMATQLSPR